MPTLNWLGKDAVVDHHRKVPLRLLTEDAALAIPGAAEGPLHTLIEGDNLHALKALLPHYRGRVKCIYIDPPYNTGNEGWVYNDNVNSPLVRDWLKKEVGRDDLSRHDKWLCMMYPRLVLLRELLRQDGAIFINIDDTELANLLIILDQIFGEDRRIAIFSWVRKKKGSNLSKEIRKVTEYIVAYRVSDGPCELHGIAAYSDKQVPLLNRANRPTVLRFPPGSLKAGRGVDDGLLRNGVFGAEKGDLSVTLKHDLIISSGQNKNDAYLIGRWRWSQSTVEEEFQHGSCFTFSKDFRINVARHDQESRAKSPSTLLTAEDGVGTNEDATEELANILQEQAQHFQFPKPVSLVQFLIQSITKTEPAAIILDAFAGSGTTGQAVMALNAQDGGKRECLLIQLGQDQEDGPNIARDITRERLARVSAGYVNTKKEAVAGLDQAWRYCRLGAAFTDGFGMPRSDLPFDELAPIVFFHATGEPMPTPPANRAFLGASSHGTGVYLLYNGDMDDKDGRSRNVLTLNMLSRLHPHAGERIVYGSACRIDAAELRRHRIVFRQYPQALAEVAS